MATDELKGTLGMKYGAHTMLSRRSLVAGSLAAGAMAALAACTPGASTGQGSGAVAEQPLTVGIARPASLDPAAATDLSSLMVVWQLFDALTTYDFETGELLGLAAERFEVSDDAQSVTFYLRDATFHDRSPVTAHDFKRAWERLCDPARGVQDEDDAQQAASYGYLLSLVKGYDELQAGETSELSGLTCPDDKTLTVALVTPYADFPYVAAHPALGPVPKAAEDAERFARQPVGNGPYRMTEALKSGAGSLTLACYSDYYGNAPVLDRVRFDIEADAASSFRAFQTGDVDVTVCPINDARDAASSLGRAEDGRTLGADGRLLCAPDLTTSMLVCNCAAAPLNDTVVRRALSLAVDREYLCKTLYRETRLPADGVVPPTVAGYREAAWPYAQFDADRAAKLLDHGYPLEAQDERNLTVRLMYNTDGGHSEVMDALADNFASLGVTCELEALEVDEFRRRLASGDFDLARVDWTADAPTLDAVLFPLFFSANRETTNASRFYNEQVDEQLAQARAERTAAARRSLYQDVDSAVGEECPVIPLMYHARVYAASDRVEHLTVDPQGRLGVATAQLGE